MQAHISSGAGTEVVRRGCQRQDAAACELLLMVVLRPNHFWAACGEALRVQESDVMPTSSLSTPMAPWEASHLHGFRAFSNGDHWGHPVGPQRCLTRCDVQRGREGCRFGTGRDVLPLAGVLLKGRLNLAAFCISR